MFAGLGLFFFAMHFLCVNLKRLADQRLRQRIAKLTSTTPAAMLVGAVMIVMTQSGSALVFLLVGLVRAGMMTLKQAQPVVLGANVGAGLVVLFLTMDIRIAVLLLIGVAGLLYAFSAQNRERVTGAAISVGLLFLGMQIMRDGASQLEATDWFARFVESSAGSPLLAFFAGAVLTFFAQSSVAVTAVMIVFLQSGLMGLQDGVMFVYGANIGGSLLMMVLSANLSGVQRQVALYKFGFNLVAALILVPLFYVELFSGVPLVIAFVSALSENAGTQAALAYAFFNAFPVPLFLVLLGPTASLLRKISPETRSELGAKAKYLASSAPDQPAIALRLVDLETKRLLDLISTGFEALRQSRDVKKLREHLDAAELLRKVILEALNDAASRRSLSIEDYERIDMLMRVHYAIGAMRDALEELGAELACLRRKRPDLSFSDSVVEGLDAILAVLISVARRRDEHDIEVLLRLTSKEGNGINTIRLAYLQGEHLLKPQDREHLLNAMNVCERLIWLFGETGKAYGSLGRAQVELLAPFLEEQRRSGRVSA